jgi:hypothetical protein
MAGDVDDVINTAPDPVVAFVVTSCSVTRELENVSGSFVSTQVVGLT